MSGTVTLFDKILEEFDIQGDERVLPRQKCLITELVYELSTFGGLDLYAEVGRDEFALMVDDIAYVDNWFSAEETWSVVEPKAVSCRLDRMLVHRNTVPEYSFVAVFPVNGSEFSEKRMVDGIERLVLHDSNPVLLVPEGSVYEGDARQQLFAYLRTWRGEQVMLERLNREYERTGACVPFPLFAEQLVTELMKDAAKESKSDVRGGILGQVQSNRVAQGLPFNPILSYRFEVLPEFGAPGLHADLIERKVDGVLNALDFPFVYNARLEQARTGEYAYFVDVIAELD